MKKSRSIIIAAVFLVMVIIVMVRFLGQPRKFAYKFYPMGGIPCRIVEYGVPEEEALQVAKAVEVRTDELENIFSIHREGSEASKLNNLSAKEWFAVSPNMYRLLTQSLSWYGKSGGAFDITVQPLTMLWKRAEEEKRLPTPREIDTGLGKVGSEYIVLSPEKGYTFNRNGLLVDFGGIAKGFILDEGGELLSKKGVAKFVLSCGGDVIMRGKESFRVGIQEPGGTEKDLMMVLNSPPGAVVTSGHYERFFDIGGKKYSHIMDPSTGRPVENSLVSVTAWAETAVDADALATSIAVLGLEKSKELLNNSGEYKAVLLAKVGDGYEVHYSKSLADRLEFMGKWAEVPRVEF